MLFKFIFICIFLKSINSFLFYNNVINNFNKKLLMSCDFYIEKNLNIYYHNNDIFSSINLEKTKGYFWSYGGDKDEYDYQYQIEELKKEQLKPLINPIIIYNKNKFIISSFEEKYKTMIENHIKEFNKNWSDIKLIVKKEQE
jgi:hypothetical protein